MLKKKALQFVTDHFYRPVPASLKQKHSAISDADQVLLNDLLVEKFFNQWPTDYIESNLGKSHLQNHLVNRLARDRRNVIPWLANLCTLQGSNILEIGCGTGSSTVALAEQGARVLGIDIEEDHLHIGARRLDFHGQTAELRVQNATTINQLAEAGSYNLVIYFATLEHMTYEERNISLPMAWDLVTEGGHLVIIETPNRLSYFDWHSSLLPFYHWLPEQLAVDYASKSPRSAFSFSIADSEEKLLSLSRFGRGISFHDLQLALGDSLELREVLSMELWNSHRTLLSRAYHFSKYFADERKYQRLIKRQTPQIGSAFFEPWLNLAIRK